MADRSEEPPGAAKAQPYRWEEEGWTDGAWWTAHRGQDFDCEPYSFRTAVYRHARAANLRAQTRMRGSSVSFRFTPAPPPSPAEE